MTDAPGCAPPAMYGVRALVRAPPRGDDRPVLLWLAGIALALAALELLGVDVSEGMALA